MKTEMKTKTKTITKKEDLTRQFRELLRVEAETWYELAIVAKKLYHEEEWRKLGYENPKSYVEKEFENKISYEIFLHRVKMGEAIEKFHIKRDEVVHLGWTKFKEIALLGLSTDIEGKELREVIKEAEGKSFRDVQDFVRKERLKYEKREVQRKVKLTFQLIDEQDNIIKEALDVAMTLLNSDNVSEGLTYICSEWLTHHVEDSEIVKRIKDVLPKPEKVKHKKHLKPEGSKDEGILL